MKKNYVVLALLVVFLVSFVLTGCYEPSPLYGKWADNYGNTITFINDGTFVAKIYQEEGNATNYEGDYSVVDNVIVFSVKGGDSMNTEWDIRGSMLYLNWTIGSGDTSKILALTLYHISK